MAWRAAPASPGRSTARSRAAPHSISPARPAWPPAGPRPRSTNPQPPAATASGCPRPRAPRRRFACGRRAQSLVGPRNQSIGDLAHVRGARRALLLHQALARVRLALLIERDRARRQRLPLSILIAVERDTTLLFKLKQDVVYPRLVHVVRPAGDPDVLHHVVHVELQGLDHLADRFGHALLGRLAAAIDDLLGVPRLGLLAMPVGL